MATTTSHGRPAVAATKKPTKKAPHEEALTRMRRYIEEVDRFASLLRETQEQIVELSRELAVRKAAYEDAKESVREAKEIEHNTVSLLLKFIVPGSCDILPLFDRMEEPDEEEHGKHAKEWRSETVAVLKLSAAAMRALIDADIVLVGQLQDRLLAEPEKWYEPVKITLGMAEAIAAKLQEFIEERTKA